MPKKKDESATFTIITVISELIQLEEGIQTMNTIEEHKFAYYKFNVGCSNCTLSISLTPLTSGNPDLYLGFETKELPTNKNYLFKSANSKGDFIQISPEGEFFYKTNLNSIKGQFIIGVYGDTPCTYSIIATTSVNRILTIFAGMPTTIHHNNPKINQIIEYNHIGNDSFIILISMQSGNAYTMANVCENSHDTNILSHIPTDDNAMWSSKNTNTPLSLTIASDDSKFKKNGLYILSLIHI